MRRAFDIDVPVCPACGGRLRLLATILDPGTIRVILVSLGLATELADRAPPEDPALATADLVAGARHPISSGPSPPVIGRGLSSLAESVPLLVLISTVEVGASVKIPA
jgi:hypothetical protein